jgi:hypothetical protein
MNDFDGLRTISIYDLEGNKVFELKTELNEIEINSTKLNSGAYNINVSDGFKTQSEKLIISK